MKGEGPPIPEKAVGLIRNLERRKGLLERVSEKESHEIPEMKIKASLLKFLSREYKGRDDESIKELNKKIFAILNRAASLASTKQDSAPVTSMYSYQRKGARKIDQDTYGELLEETKKIIQLCEEYGISIKSITGMQAGLGVPDTKKLEGLLEWCKTNGIDLKSITGMQHGLGVPDTKKLDGLLEWCKTNGIDLKSITGMQAGLGVPDTKKLEGLLEWCEKKNIPLVEITKLQIGIPTPLELEKIKERLLS